MASWTDTNPPIFSPYVSQIPLEAYTAVGMQLQDRYNQGIQRIQSQIDQVAGMEIYRDVDKQLLQGKLNSLGQDLKKVAAGDFSQYQLVNSVGGMINKIGRDEKVLEAVKSTQIVKKGFADMEAARKEGKSSPSNEWDFKSQVGKWVSSPTPGESFNGGYMPYTNYKKNALDVLKSLKPDSTITDDAFTIGPDGKLTITDATVRKEFAGVSADKIQKALMATLTPDDFRQMEIDGRYSYANTPPERLSGRINSSYTRQLEFFNNQRKTFEDAKYRTKSNVEKQLLNSKIEQLDKIISSVTKEYSGMQNMLASGNLDAVKSQLYTSDFLNNFSQAFSYTETSQTQQTNPLATIAMQRARMEQDWKEFLLRDQWDKEKFRLTYEQKEREIKGKNTPSTIGGLPFSIPKEDVPKFTIDKFKSDTEDSLERIKKADSDLLNSRTFKGKSQEWLDEQRLSWEKNPEGIDSKLAYHFLNTAQDERASKANMVMVSEIEKLADQKYGVIQDKIPNDPPVTYQSPEGIVYTYTPEDFVNINLIASNYINQEITRKNKPFNPLAPGVYDLEKAERELSPKEFTLLKAKVSSKTPDAATRLLANRAKHYEETINAPFRQELKEKNKFINEELLNRLTKQQGVSYGIPAGTADERNLIGNVLVNFANLADTQKGGLANSPQFDSEVAKTIALSNNVSYNMEIVEGTEFQEPMYRMRVAGLDGGEVVSTEFMMTPEQKFTAFGNMFEPSPAIAAFRPYEEQIRKMGGSTTAYSEGPSSHENAFLNKLDFSNVQHYGVKGNIEVVAPGLYTIKISAYDPIREQWFDDIELETRPVSAEKVINDLQMLNDAALFELLNDTEPTVQDLKRIQEAAKKPPL